MESNSASARKIRFRVGYCAPPFFCSDLDAMGYLDFEDLDIPADLLCEIKRWDGDFQKTFNEEYPPDSAILSQAEIDSHNARGSDLADSLRGALGSRVEVVFVPLE